MGARYNRPLRRGKVYGMGAETLIERLKKTRALNCDPSVVGMDSFILRKVNRINILARS